MSKGRILVVDDEESARAGLSKLLTQDGYEVETAEDGAVAFERLSERAPNIVITDLKMPVMDGMELLAKTKKHNPAIPIIVVTAFDDLGTAVQAMRAGAADYLTKPVDFDALTIAVERSFERGDLTAEAENLRRQLHHRDQAGLEGLLGTSDAMQRVYRVARQVAPSRASVLITGESGTGKGELARAVHTLSDRATKPFVALHCAALAETLLESELFGHERGAFTGAEKKRIGRFEQAHGGTLFLDEIGEISPLTQVKLLRVLQERAFERVGGNETVNVDVRLVAATNKDLAAEVRERRFREDLYYRLHVVHIEMPPLRLRGNDVLILADHFLRKFARENRKHIDGFSNAARSKIAEHKWPGNVRELENATERAVVLSQSAVIDTADLPFDSLPTIHEAARVPGATMAELEKHAILTTLEATHGSTTRAAEILDISVRTIQNRLHEYGMAPGSKKSE